MNKQKSAAKAAGALILAGGLVLGAPAGIGSAETQDGGGVVGSIVGGVVKGVSGAIHGVLQATGIEGSGGGGIHPPSGGGGGGCDFPVPHCPGGGRGNG